MEKILTLAQILAMVMYSEAGILRDDNAAMAVGHVFLNRLEHGGFGDTLEEISKGFHAVQYINYDDVPEKYFDLARFVRLESIEKRDVTNGSLYVMSLQDTQVIAELAGYPNYASLLRMAAYWISKPRIIGGTTYALYAFKKFPVTLMLDLADTLKDVPDDIGILP